MTVQYLMTILDFSILTYCYLYDKQQSNINLHLIVRVPFIYMLCMLRTCPYENKQEYSTSKWQHVKLKLHSKIRVFSCKSYPCITSFRCSNTKILISHESDPNRSLPSKTWKTHHLCLDYIIENVFSFRVKTSIFFSCQNDGTCIYYKSCLLRHQFSTV